jgi:hypothetical protein
MPDIEIKNETEDVLRMSLTFGIELFCDNVGAGGVFKAHVAPARLLWDTRKARVTNASLHLFTVAIIDTKAGGQKRPDEVNPVIPITVVAPESYNRTDNAIIVSGWQEEQVGCSIISLGMTVGDHNHRPQTAPLARLGLFDLTYKRKHSNVLMTV